MSMFRDGRTALRRLEDRQEEEYECWEILCEEARARKASIPVLISDCRLSQVVRHRNAIMKRMRREGYSTTLIGRIFNRDHSSVSYATKGVFDRE